MVIYIWCHGPSRHHGISSNNTIVKNNSYWIIFSNTFVSLLQKDYFANHSRQENSSREIRRNPYVNRFGFSGDSVLHCNGEMRYQTSKSENDKPT